MAAIITNIERFFKEKSILSSLILINVIVFLFIKITGVAFLLFNKESSFLIEFIELPASFQNLVHYPWTIISYMFTHIDFLHILFNMLWLYWFGNIFLTFWNQKQLGGVYLLGGISGGILFILTYNIFPYFKDFTNHSYLIGASASVMAIVFAASFYKKDYEINLIFLGKIKLIYIAIFFLILDLISIDSNNPGGHIAHLGGALLGFLFSFYFKKGKDLTFGINFIIDKCVNLFTKEESPRKRSNIKLKKVESDYEYNKRKSDQNKEIDRILDKIKKSGYNNLTENEKKTLFNANK